MTLPFSPCFDENALFRHGISVEVDVQIMKRHNFTARVNKGLQSRRAHSPPVPHLFESHMVQSPVLTKAACALE